MGDKNFRYEVSQYILGIKGSESLPEIAIKGVEEGFESDNLFMLAGLTKNDNKFEIETHFKKVIKELDYKLPEKEGVIYIVAKVILNHILSGVEDFEKSRKLLRNFVNEYTNYDYFDRFSPKNYKGEQMEDTFRELYRSLFYYSDIWERDEFDPKLEKERKCDVINESKISLEKISKILKS